MSGIAMLEDAISVVLGANSAQRREKKFSFGVIEMNAKALEVLVIAF
jgi:hypothetical protein